MEKLHEEIIYTEISSHVLHSSRITFQSKIRQLCHLDCSDMNIIIALTEDGQLLWVPYETSIEPPAVFSSIPTSLRFHSISCGHSHALAYAHDSSLYSFGSNLLGQCGRAESFGSVTTLDWGRIPLHSSLQVASFEARFSTSVILTDDHHLHCFGSLRPFGLTHIVPSLILSCSFIPIDVSQQLSPQTINYLESTYQPFAQQVEPVSSPNDAPHIALSREKKSIRVMDQKVDFLSPKYFRLMDDTFDHPYVTSYEDATKILAELKTKPKSKRAQSNKTLNRVPPTDHRDPDQSEDSLRSTDEKLTLKSEDLSEQVSITKSVILVKSWTIQPRTSFVISTEGVLFCAGLTYLGRLLCVHPLLPVPEFVTKFPVCTLSTCSTFVYHSSKQPILHIAPLCLVPTKSSRHRGHGLTSIRLPSTIIDPSSFDVVACSPYIGIVTTKPHISIPESDSSRSSPAFSYRRKKPKKSNSRIPQLEQQILIDSTSPLIFPESLSRLNQAFSNVILIEPTGANGKHKFLSLDECLKENVDIPAVGQFLKGPEDAKTAKETEDPIELDEDAPNTGKRFSPYRSRKIDMEHRETFHVCRGGGNMVTLIQRTQVPP
ncbi:hypothetical protein BLNAU_1431a [Blattamonas nauphoetae]|uniref:Uncharacterized protein n=1 Tax=Blattamonas nauphoetae TaxID=2049346 RepID=A0ABQ9YI27_9EUKA|nr:hypothetical protein BLNAU_1431a [Blattamonas nauphoetae]